MGTRQEIILSILQQLEGIEELKRGQEKIHKRHKRIFRGIIIRNYYYIIQTIQECQNRIGVAGIKIQTILYTQPSQKREVFFCHKRIESQKKMTLLKRRRDKNYKLFYIYCDNYVFNGLKSNHLKFGYILHHDFFLLI